MKREMWVYVDHYQGRLSPASLEALGAGKLLAEALNGRITALILGFETDRLVEEIFGYGAEDVFLADDPLLRDYRGEPYTTVLTDAARASQPQVILFPGTSRGRELAAMSAIDLHTGVLPDAVRTRSPGGQSHRHPTCLWGQGFIPRYLPGFSPNHYGGQRVLQTSGVRCRPYGQTDADSSQNR